MKKILYSLLMFISLFIFVDKVSAANYTFPVMDNFLNYYDQTYDLSKDFEEILSIAENKNYDVIIKLYHYATTGTSSTAYCNTQPTVGMCPYVSYYHVLVIQNGFSPAFNLSSSGSIYSSINSNIVGININVDSNYTTSYNNLITALNNSDFSDFSNNFDASTGSGKQWYYQSSNNNQMIYGASSDYKIISLDSSSNTYYFGEYKITSGSLLPTYKNYYYVEPEPELYIFDEYIYDYNYSQMIFDFDLSIYVERDNTFDLLLNDFYVENEIRDTILYDVEKFDIGYPYFEYETSDGYRGLLYLKDLDGNDIILKKKMYIGKYLDALPENTISLRFIVPLKDTAEHRLKLSFITYYPFTISYLTDEQFHSYYETVDLSNKYGVMFIPKLVENNSDIMSSFETWGIEKVLVYDTYDYKTQPIEIYTDDITTFDYTFKYENTNYNLFFITNINSSYSAVEYDTRYFTYKIVNSKYSVGDVINPNTGDTFYIDFSNVSNLETNFESLSSVFEFISEQLDKNNSSYILFHDVVNVFFNTMPDEVYVLILTVFAVILFGVTLGLGGWK